MNFSELIPRARKALERFDSAPQSLELKTALGDPAQWYARNGFRSLAEAYGSSGSSWSGESVTEETAQNHSVVFACKRILAESIGFLPISMMQERNGEKSELDHPMNSGIKDGNYEVTGQEIRETMTGHMVLGGNAYAQIFRRSGSGVAYELSLLMPNQVTVTRDAQKRLVYVVKEGNAAARTYTVERDRPQDILHVRGLGPDGVMGYSVLRLARQSIGTALAAERNVGKFYANGGRLPYVLSLAQKMNDTDFEKFRSDWERVYAEPHRAPILEPFIKEYKQIGVSAVDAQLLETRQFSVPEICRWFGISPHLAGDLSNANNSITEQLALEFVTFRLNPLVTRWEQALRRCILTPAEKAQSGVRYFWKINVNALLRGDFATRMQGYSIALQNGFFNRNEVRDLEDRDAFEGGDDYTIQLNMQALPMADPQPQQSGQSLIRLGNGKAYRRVA